VEVLGRGVAWLDAGTPEALLQAANFVQAVEDRQGMMISSPEEIAFRLSYIGPDELRQQAKAFNNQYGDYLLHLAEGII
jgi:glucose-1-phosphate thymidylyltransferase